MRKSRPIKSVSCGVAITRTKGMNGPACSVACRFATKVRAVESGCVEWAAHRNALGYGVFRDRHGESMKLAHRVAYALANGPIPDGLLVLHRCDNPSCVNVAHLYLGTDSDNTRDKLERGRMVVRTGERHHAFLRPWVYRRGADSWPAQNKDRMARGSKAAAAKMTEEKVIAARAMRDDGATFAAIGAAFGIGLTTAHKLCTGKTWAHVQ